jgi:peptidyl-prolyl cis-trans isomerase SurA
MQKALLLIIASLFLSKNIHAQNDVLFSVGETKVKKSEFEAIYKKNNFNNKADYSRKSLDDYLNLYVNFRLKVKEALEQGLDKNDHFKEELKTYETQLLDSYLDKEVADKLIKQEYERAKTDVNVSHIYISFKDINEKEAMVKMLGLQQKLKSGTAFEEVAKFSEDKATMNNGGNLGWFNSYQINLPELEDAVYTMKPGEVSNIIQTRLGLHIVKLNEVREARPKLKVAIIKRFFSISDASEAAKKIVSDSMQLAFSKLKSGESFENVVDRFSEDEFSRANKGQLEWFGINTYAKIFEETAYSLKDGEVSAPFKTSAAMYIVKRLETSKSLTLDEATPVLKAKLPNTPQFLYALDKYVDKLAVKYNAVENKQYLPAFKKYIVALSNTSPFVYKDTVKPNILLQIGNKVFTENDYGKKIQETYYSVTPRTGMERNDALIKNTTQQLILDHFKNDIRENNSEFKALMDEYKNGIMIFTLSEKNIWNKASDDSVGLLAFYNAHKQDFNLKKRATLRTITVNNSKQAKAVAKILKSDKSITDEMLAAKLKESGISDQKINTQVVTEDGKISLSAESVSSPVSSPEKKYVITQVYNILPEKPRAFEECRGYVVAGYQESLEKKWLEDLKKKYPVSVNKDVFESLVKK